VLTSRSALDGERRQVTVLFSDVVGFTPLSERMGSEVMHRIMDGCFRQLTADVQRYEGTVTQYAGDGMMALFGAPIAHENAPERALRAALAMQARMVVYAEELEREHGIEFRMRIGVNTGFVVVGTMGDDRRMDYTAIGDTTNLAARLQVAAPPGGVLASEHTVKLVAGRFATRLVGALTLKGVSAQVTAYEVLRALPRAPLVAGGDRELTPLIGRDAELATLDPLLAHAMAGSGQVAFAVGEAGIGKSRLIHEFQRRLRARHGDELTWLEGRCVSFSREISFLAMIDVVKMACGIEESDGEPAIIDKLHRLLAGLGTAAVAMEPVLRSLLAVDPGDQGVATMSASARRFAIFEALKQLVLTLAARQPLVLLIEDLHWIDRASEEFLCYIVDALAAARVLLLCTYRPGYQPTFGERSFVTRLPLQRLSADQTADMAAAILEASAIPAEIRSLIGNKAEGNPFFIEEVTKSLIEIGALRRTDNGYVLDRPIDEISIPDTIQDVIMARIDRLGEAPKRAIQVASVIGREFAVRLLQRASDLGDGVAHMMGDLRSLELVYEKSGVPELAYMFKHALTHDVAYQSLLSERRQQLHRGIGQAIEELYADRLAEYWETLAYHFYAGEDWPRAFDYLVQAADKARRAFANGEAVAFYDRALVAAQHLTVDPAMRRVIYTGKGRAHFALSEFAEAAAAYRTALDLADTDAERAPIEDARAEALLWGHEFDAAITAAGNAIALAGTAHLPHVSANATHSIGVLKVVHGELDEGRRHLDNAITLWGSSDNVKACGKAMGMRAMLAGWRGDYQAALPEIEMALKGARQLNELVAAAQAYSTIVMILGGAGEYDRALTLASEGIALQESIGDRTWRARLWNTRGWILSELGAFDAAEEANRRCLELVKQLGTFHMAAELIANAEANLADLAIAQGDLRMAEPHLAGVGEIVHDRRKLWMQWRYGMHYHASAAALALIRGETGRARERLAACLTTARATSSRRYLARAGRLVAACLVAEGNLAEADRELTEAVHIARAIGNPPQLWHALTAHGRVLRDLGRADEATAAWRDARGLIETVAATLPAELAQALRRSPAARALEEVGA
jgi:class 3 adenylate cyclase/tetratricopeptide (TPR) repeat protein